MLLLLMMPPRTDPAAKVGVLMSLEFSPAQLNSWSQRWSLESSVAPNPPQVAGQTSIPFEQKCTFFCSSALWTGRLSVCACWKGKCCCCCCCCKVVVKILFLAFCIFLVLPHHPEMCCRFFKGKSCANKGDHHCVLATLLAKKITTINHQLLQAKKQKRVKSE